jgi:hypothetical protein
MTPTVTPTFTNTPTYTVTPTYTITPTLTADCNFDFICAVVTPTPTVTITQTPTLTPTYTITPTFTPTVTPTITVTQSITPTITPTNTITMTPTFTVTQSLTPTYTITPTLTADCAFDFVCSVITPTPTVTITQTPTITPTFTATPTLTPTITVTQSITPTLTPTLTPTITVTQSVTPTITSTITPTFTVTPTLTADCAFDFVCSVITPTPTVTLTQTPTITPTFSATPTPTPTINAAPTDILISDNLIYENTSSGTLIGTLSAVSLDVYDTHTFSMVTGPFYINGTGLYNSIAFNYETSATQTARVRVVDSANNTFEKDIVINVLNVNETPYGFEFTGSIPENSSIGTTVGTITALDPDAGETFVYEFYNIPGVYDNYSFSLTTGGTLTNAAVFNYEVKTGYTINVKVTDSANQTFTGLISVPVTNVNEEPTGFTLSNSSISENVPTGTTVGTITGLDPDAGNTFTYELLGTESYPDNANFYLDGAAIKSAVIFNYESKTSYNVGIKVLDQGGLYFLGSTTINISNVTVTVSASATTNVTCNGGSNGVITVSNATGGSSPYTYSKNGSTYQVSTSFGGLTAGSYSIYAKDVYNEVGILTGVTVTQPTIISYSISGTNPTCYGDTDGSLTISSVGGGVAPYTYSIDGVNYQSGTIFSNLGAGTYTGYTKDSSGCVRTNTTGISKEQVAATVSQVNVGCYGNSTGSITVSSGSGGNGGTYQAKIGSGSYQNLPATFGSLSATSYTITVKDGGTCTRTYPVTITQPAAPLVASGTGDTNFPPTCFGGSDGSVSFHGTGGTSPYEYSINSVDYQFSGTFTGLTSGNYTGYVRDANGCTDTIARNINRTEIATSISTTNVSCNGGSNGIINVTSASSSWGGTVQVKLGVDGTYYNAPKEFTTLTAGNYTVYAKDSQDCIKTIPITLTQPTTQTATIILVSQPTCAGGNTDGVITVESTGGVWPKTYKLYADTSAPYNTCDTLIQTWTNIASGDSSFNVTGLTSNGYCLEVTDANGCVVNTSSVMTLTPSTGYFKYQVIRCSDNAYLYMTSPDSLPSSFMTGVAAVKINDVCYQVDYFVETTCTQSSIHLVDGQYSSFWNSCSSCTSGGGGNLI